MACWPANIVGAFFVFLLMLDIAYNNMEDLPMHTITGILLTLVFWFLCSILGQAISGAVLAVPAIVVVVFMFSVWFVGKSIKNRGCCMTCSKRPGIKYSPESQQAARNAAAAADSKKKNEPRCQTVSISGIKTDLKVVDKD